MKKYLWVAIALGFIAVLLYATVTSTPEPPLGGASYNRQAAERVCTDAVSERIQGARFPFAAEAVLVGEGSYRLNGMVDSPASGDAVRRNYECVVQQVESDSYRTESVRIWQSH
ncbi:MAG TPA: hypothetical protein VFI91_06860 [Longimicrobiaceae bacterium]|nr:hypothetical protein [Longimicrobiaceae bacterium]